MPLLFFHGARGTAGLAGVRYGKQGVACLCPPPHGRQWMFQKAVALGSSTELTLSNHVHSQPWLNQFLQLGHTV
jgi:hypothetical protein